MSISLRLYYVSFIHILLYTTAFAQEELSLGNKPLWTEDIQYKNNSGEVESPYIYLLVDIQNNASVKEKFYHYAVKINNPEGVQDMSSISVIYDPSYQKITFHNIAIHRDGKSQFRSAKNFKLLQRETDLDRALYDGTVSAIKELKDVRPNDIIEYSYTISGSNPVYKEHTFERFFQDFSVHIDRLCQIFIHDQKVNLKYYNDAVEPAITNEDRLTKYRWDLKNLLPTYEDYTAPPWVNQRNEVSISSMQSWKEVAEWAAPLYQLSNSEKADLKERLPKSLSFTKNESSILTAIRFVQDEIRYLGFEEGVNAFQPHNPKKVLEQRFGDCKDKSFLLSLILQEIGVDATPMLVNSRGGKALDNRTPTPNVFDHCIVNFNYNGEKYSVDPTISNQAGNLKNLSIPDYHKGLPIHSNTSELINLKSNSTASIIVNERISLDSVGGGADYEITTHYSGIEADYQRASFSSNSKSDIKNYYQKFYKNAYSNLKIQSISTTDSTKHNSNEFIVKEVYKIPSIWEKDDGVLKLFIYSMELDDLLNLDIPEDNKLPYYLGERKEYVQNVVVELPEEWTIQNDEYEISNNNIDYNYSIKYADQSINITHRYLIKESTVAAENKADVVSELKKIRSESGYYLTYNEDLINRSSGSTPWVSWLMVLIGLVAGLLIAHWAYFKYDPVSARTTKEMSIGGWLLLPALGIILSPFRMVIEIIDLIKEGVYEQSTWSYLWNDKQYELITLVFTGSILNIMLFIFSITLIVLFLMKRTNIPNLMIGFYLFNLSIMAMSTASIYFFDISEDLELVDLFRYFISCCIWIPYFIKSKRVKNTFIYRKSGSAE